MKKIMIGTIIATALFVSGCGSDTIERVKGHQPFHDENLTLTSALSNWSACTSGVWDELKLKGKNVVEYTCELKNVKKFIKVMAPYYKNPKLVPDVDSVFTKFTWSVDDQNVELLESVYVWNFSYEKFKSPGSKEKEVLKLTYEENNSDGVSVANSSAEKFDMSFFDGGDHRKKMVAEMYVPDMREFEIQAFMKYRKELNDKS